MQQIAWLTDIHLNFLSNGKLDRFFADLDTPEIDALLISGDIGEAHTVTWYLEAFDQLQKPVYFVLGNHDFYFGSFAHVHAKVTETTEESDHLHWLTQSGIIELSPTTALIGHDSWADGRYGDYVNSPVLLNDYLLIRDFVGLDAEERLQKLNALGDAAANYFENLLPKALADYEHVYVVTHVPPFRGSNSGYSKITDEHFLPHYGCKAVGDVLLRIMQDHPQQCITVLSGHIHGTWQSQMLPNLTIHTGAAKYGAPRVVRLFEVQ